MDEWVERAGEPGLQHSLLAQLTQPAKAQAQTEQDKTHDAKAKSSSSYKKSFYFNEPNLFEDSLWVNLNKVFTAVTYRNWVNQYFVSAFVLIRLSGIQIQRSQNGAQKGQMMSC